MNEAVVYLLKMVACSTALYAYYLLALRNRIFHQWNRFYLLAAVVASLIFPLIPMPELYGASVQQQADLYGLFTSSSAALTLSENNTGGWGIVQWITVCYIGVGAVLLCRAFYGLVQILRLLRRSSVQQLGKVSFVSTHHPAAPFSFFKWLFWKKDIELQSPGGQSIFRHELVHIQEHHSVDKMLMQAVLALCWINPIFWIIGRELHLIHEFIADKKAVGHAGTESLAAMILQSAYGSQYNQLINPFFQQPIKRRIAMLQKTLKQPRNAYMSRLLTIPLCVLLLFACAKKEAEPETLTESPAASGKPALADSIPANELKEVRVNKSDSTKTISLLYKNGKEETLTEKEAHDRGLLQKPSLVEKRQEEIAALVVIDGVEDGPANQSKKLKAMAPDRIEIMNVWKDEQAIKKYGEKGKNGVIEIITKESNASVGVMPAPSSNIVFSKVERAPTFPQGETAWREFLAKNLDAATPVKNGAPPGSYTTVLQFKVATDGSLSDFKPLTDHGYGMEQEVLQMIQKSPKWEPAEQNGRKVAAIHKQPVTFVIAEE